jgi:PAS domain S-box-containing protein
VFLLALFAILPWLPTARGDTSKKNILVLSSADSLLPASQVLVQNLQTGLEAGRSEQIVIFTEYLDAYRFHGEENDARMAALLESKYAAVPIDLLVTLGPEALDLMTRVRATLFPTAPIVFTTVGAEDLKTRTIPPGTTGVVSHFDAETTLELALRLQPDAHQVAVVTGASAFDQNWEAVAREKFGRFEDRLEVIYLSGLPMDQLLIELARLPPRTIVIYLAVFEDGIGQRFVPQDVAARVASAANAPVYGVYDTYLGHGIVGGYMDTFEAVGAEAARLGLRLLAGERPEDISPHEADTHAYLVDWWQLQRWGLSEANLPPGTVVRFKEPSLWAQYREQVIAAIAVVLVQFLLIVGLVLQVRQRWRAEASLRDSEERTSLAVESANLGLWRLDVPTYRIWATDTYKSILGLDPREGLTQQSFINAVHPDDRQGVIETCTDAIARGAPYEQEYRVVHADGRVRWILDRARNFRDAAGKSLRMSGVVMDITERKEGEEAMRESEERYRNVVETQTELICRYLPDTTLTFVNDAYCRCFGRGRDDLVGTKFIELIPESARPAVLQQIASLAERPRTETHEHEVLRPDGTTGWQQWTGHVIVDSYGQVVEIQAIGRDTTELRLAELEAEDRRREVRHLTRVSILGELSGALAHELNQPLTAILSNAQAAQRLLAQSPPDLEEVQAILSDIANADKRASDVINRLRALMKKEEAKLQPLDVNALAIDVLDLAHSELIERKIAVTPRLAPFLPKIRGDRVQLQQVLLNLVMNACEAMAVNDGIERAIEVSTASDGNQNLQLTVADRGPGIPPTMADRIFEPFVTTKAQGLGLGLSICRAIVSAHGGRMWAANNPDRGARFFVSLPIPTGG